MRKIIVMIFNLLLGLWSYMPVLCLSDDDNYLNVKIGNNRNFHLRISLFNIMLGGVIVYIFSYDISQKNFEPIKVLRLIDMDGNCLEDEDINAIQKRFREHIAVLTDDDLEVEKEKLLYHIEREEQRINSSVDKINIYITVMLTVIPIVVALIDFKEIKEFPIVIRAMICIGAYGIVNIVFYFYQTLKVRGVNKSSFSDLRASTDKKREIVVQYQYDWQQLKYKAQLFVNFVLNLQNWVILMIALAIIIPFGISMQNNKPLYVLEQDSKGAIFTINAEEINIPYSNSSINFRNVVLDIETKKYDHLIVLTKENEFPMEINELTKYKELQIEVIVDTQLEKNVFKLIEVK